MKFDYDDWEQPKEPSDAYDRIVRPADRWTREEDEARYSRRGIPMRDCEYADFVTRGGKIDYGEKRAAKQRLNDQRYDQRTEHNRLLMDIVTEVVATWNPANYLGRHRAIVREILGKSRNQRRRKLSNISTMQRRHQEAIRLVYALTFDDISQAEYCQNYTLDPADASRMLDHLYKKEPGLADAIGAISACSAVTSWQNRQQKQKLCDKRERATLVFGFDYSEIPDHGGWIKLADLSAGCVKSYRTGKAESIAVWDDIPLSRFRTVSANRFEHIHLPQYLDRPKTWRVASKPFDLHEPATWYASDYLTLPRKQRLPLHYWNALHEPMRVVQRLRPLIDRYRAISRKVKLKGDGQKVWRISRALDGSQPKYEPTPDGILAAWLRWASQTKVLGDPYLSLRSRHGIFHSRLVIDGPIHTMFMCGDLPSWATLDLKTRDLPVGRHENELLSGGVSFIFRGLPVADCNGKAPPSLKQDWKKIEDRLAEAKWSKGPMCNPVRGISSPYEGDLRDPRGNPIPIKVRPNRLRPFTRLGPILWIGPLKRPSKEERERWKNSRIFYPARNHCITLGDQL